MAGYIQNEDVKTLTELTGSSPAGTVSQLIHDDKIYATGSAQQLSAKISSIDSAISGKEPAITSGTTGQYWRGDKTFQTLNATAVGLGNVTNDAQVKTSDLTTKGDLLTRTASAITRLGVGTNGQVLTADSAQAEGVKWADPTATMPARLTALYDAVVGSAAQVTSGAATHSSIASALSAISSGNSILILAGTYTENPSIATPCTVEGQGNSTVISGNVTFTSGCTHGLFKGVRVTGNITLNASSNYNSLTDFFVANTSVVTDNGTSNHILGIRD